MSGEKKLGQDFLTEADDEAMEREVERQKERQKEYEENSVASLKTFPYFIKGTGVASKVIFLAPKPITFHAHSIEVYNKDRGKKEFEFVMCTAGDASTCKYCDEGNKATWKGAFPVFDLGTWEDKEGNKHSNGVRVMLKPFADVQAILREFDEMPRTVINKDGAEVEVPAVRNSVVRVNKDGTGTNTKYSYRALSKESVDNETRDRITKFMEKYPVPNEFTRLWILAHDERVLDKIKANGGEYQSKGQDSYARPERQEQTSRATESMNQRQSQVEPSVEDDDIPF